MAWRLRKFWLPPPHYMLGGEGVFLECLNASGKALTGRSSSTYWGIWLGREWLEWKLQLGFWCHIRPRNILVCPFRHSVLVCFFLVSFWNVNLSVRPFAKKPQYLRELWDRTPGRLSVVVLVTGRVDVPHPRWQLLKCTYDVHGRFFQLVTLFTLGFSLVRISQGATDFGPSMP